MCLLGPPRTTLSRISHSIQADCCSLTRREKPMRKALKRAVRVLVAAGAFSLVRPAVAQQTTPVPPPAPPNAPGSVVSPNLSATRPASYVVGSQRKREELEVELALLGNPSTFAFVL